VKILKKGDDKKVFVRRKSVSKKKSVETDNLSLETDNPPAQNSIKESSIDMIGYIDRFRSKILVTLLLFMILTPVAFYFSNILLNYINRPFIVTGNKLNIFTLMGGFMLKFKVSAAATLFVLMPLIFYQIYSVVSDGVVKKSKIFSRVTIIVAVIFFYGGVAAAFFLLLPMMVEIMLSFNHADMISMVGADNYLSFSLFLCLTMGVLAEIPIIVLLLTRMGIVTPEMLAGKRKYAVVVIWIIAALTTPPDVLSQAMVAVPLIIIFEVSILISKFVAARKKSGLI
jgi:sec-independent protein translocase protein TatC